MNQFLCDPLSPHSLLIQYTRYSISGTVHQVQYNVCVTEILYRRQNAKTFGWELHVAFGRIGWFPNDKPHRVNNTDIM